MICGVSSWAGYTVAGAPAGASSSIDSGCWAWAAPPSNPADRKTARRRGEKAARMMGFMKFSAKTHEVPSPRIPKGMRPQVPLLDRAATIGFADVRRFPKAQQASPQAPDMPELPEVETTRRGIAPELEGQRCDGARVRQPRLRHPIPDQLDPLLASQSLLGVERRAKYLLLRFPTGRLLIHLGMSGSLLIVPEAEAPGKHDHVDLLF